MIFESTPKDFSPQFETCSCFIECDGEFLMLKRHADKPFGNMWCLPGGKKDTETLHECVIREVQEETGLLLDSPIHVKTVYVDNGQQFLYHIFKASIPIKQVPTLKPNEHIDFCWITPTDSLNLNLLPGQKKCTEMLYLT